MCLPAGATHRENAKMPARKAPQQASGGVGSHACAQRGPCPCGGPAAGGPPDVRRPGFQSYVFWGLLAQGQVLKVEGTAAAVQTFHSSGRSPNFEPLPAWARCWGGG